MTTQDSWIENITPTQSQLPPKLLVYGVPKIGKSTLLAAMPKPIVLDFDDGLIAIRVERIAKDRVPTWTDALTLMSRIADDPRDFKTFGVDTLDGLETLAIDHVCKKHHKSNLSEFDYGGGYIATLAEWRVMLGILERARRNGMMIALLAHATVKEATDPRVGKYDQFQPQLEKKTWGVTHKWADLIGFAHVDTSLISEKEKRAFVKPDARILYTTTGTGFVAGNRWSLPTVLPLDWPTLHRNIDPNELQETILDIARAGGAERESKARAFIGEADGDVKALQIILQSLKKQPGAS